MYVYIWIVIVILAIIGFFAKKELSDDLYDLVKKIWNKNNQITTIIKLDNDKNEELRRMTGRLLFPSKGSILSLIDHVPDYEDHTFDKENKYEVTNEPEIEQHFGENDLTTTRVVIKVKPVVIVTFGFDNEETGFDVNAPVAQCEPSICPLSPDGHEPVEVSWEKIIETKSIPNGTHCACGARMVIS